jgi:transcriptional regulator with XRE-family HTH domain
MKTTFDCCLIIKQRNTLKLTQQDLSAMVEVSQPTYNRWESGKSEPNASQLPFLAIALKVEVDFFYR